MSVSENPVSPTPAGSHPDCPTLTGDQGLWLKENFLPGYIQAIDVVKAKKPNAMHVWDPGKEFVREQVLNMFIDEFWDHTNEPNMVSVLQVSSN